MLDLADLPAPLIRHLVGLWRRRWVVALGAWAVALGLWFLIWLIPDKFESRAQVFVQTETVLQPVIKDLAPAPDYAQRIDVMRQQLLSRPNVQEIIYRSGLDKTIKASNEAERRLKMEGLVDWASNAISIESPKDRYFVITYRNNDRELARRVVDATLNLLIEQDFGASVEDKAEAKRVLAARIADSAAKLKTQEDAIAAFRRLHADELAAADGQDRRVQDLAAEVQRTEDLLDAEERQIATLRAVLAQTPATSSGDELSALKIQLAQLRSQYNDSYPDIQNLKARIAELEGGSAALPGNPEYRRLGAERAAAETQVAALRARLTKLRGDQAALSVSLGQAPAVQLELQRLEREKALTEKNNSELLAGQNQLDLSTSVGPGGGQGVEYKIFERPTAALRPVSPPRGLFIAGALFAALGAGVAAAAALTFLDRTFSQTATLEKTFGLPVLGSLSTVPSAYARALLRKDLIRLSGAFAALAAATGVYLYLSVLRPPAASLESGAKHAATAVLEERG